MTSGFSDNRLKNYTSNITNSIDMVNKLNGFYYTPSDLAISLGVVNNLEGREGGLLGDIVEVGLSAQEVQSVLPEIVKIAPFDSIVDSSNNIVSKSGEKYLTINYERLAPLFVEAIKELNNKMLIMSQELAELKEFKRQVLAKEL
jgi:hypothetical protein